MSLEDGDIIRVVINQTVATNTSPIINVYWYEVSEVTGVISTPEDLSDVAADVFITLATAITAIQSQSVTWNNAVLENMSNLIDIASYVPTTAPVGAIAAFSDPTQTAASYKLVRTDRRTRNGSKRIGGIGDSLTNDTTGLSFVTDPRNIAIQDALLDPIPVVVSAGGSCLLTPVIVRRTPPGVPVSVFQPVFAVVFRGWGTQNTRKRLLS